MRKRNDTLPLMPRRIHDYSVTPEGELTVRTYDRYKVYQLKPGRPDTYWIQAQNRTIVKRSDQLDVVLNGHYVTFSDDPRTAVEAILAHHLGRLAEAEVRVSKELAAVESAERALACLKATAVQGITEVKTDETAAVQPTDDDCGHAFQIGDRVRILTKRPGCHDRRVGTVTARLDEHLRPDPDSIVPRFYEVTLDEPVDLGDGVSSRTDVHPHEQVFPLRTARESYWSRKPSPKKNS